MSYSPVQPFRIVLPIVVAAAVGLGMLWVGGERGATQRPDAAAVAAIERLQPAHAAAPASAAVPGTPVANSDVTAAVPPAEQAPVATSELRGGIACASPHVVAIVQRDLPVSARPGGARIGTMPARSHYLGAAMVAWVQARTPDGRWGRVTIPWGEQVARPGWIPLGGVRTGSTRTMAVADLSERRLRLYRGCDEVLDVPSAIGAAGSPSPVGRFWVTDRVAVPSNQAYFGSYAFGLSTIQPNPPAGWTGGNQMAIHGTNAPATIGTAASAGCLRVGEPALEQLRPLLRAGTPVVIQA